MPFWDPSEVVPGSSRAFLERSRFVRWPFRGFLPKNFQWHLVARIQFRTEAAACWPILAVVGLSFLGSGPKQDEEVCEYSERESSCWAGDTVIHQEAQLYLDCHRCADQESGFDTMPAKEDTERSVCCDIKWASKQTCFWAADTWTCRRCASSLFMTVSLAGGIGTSPLSRCGEALVASECQVKVDGLVGWLCAAAGRGRASWDIRSTWSCNVLCAFNEG